LPASDYHKVEFTYNTLYGDMTIEEIQAEYATFLDQLVVTVSVK